MSESGAEKLDDLVLGAGTEVASESDEVFAERLKEAQQKIAGIRKDEKKAQNFDHKLAKIISNLSPEALDFVIFLINHNIPSLTILAFISIANEDAGKTCFIEFDKFIQEKANFSIVKFNDPKIEEKISYWWTFILAADHVSTTVKLKSLRENDKFVSRLSRNLADLLVIFLHENSVTEFDRSTLKKMLAKYEKMMFE